MNLKIAREKYIREIRGRFLYPLPVQVGAHIMIETYCKCLTPVRAEESAVGTVINCAKCKADILLIAGEFIQPGTAVGDFDSRLLIARGPSGVGQVLALGGVPDLQLGKAADRHIHLPGTSVSRSHARLSRLDFGPSRWQIVDTQSRNGVFVNEQRVLEAELRDGDMIRIGEFELRYVSKIPKPPPRTPALDELVCPSCKEIYNSKTTVCIACGINIKTGRPLVTSRELDENDLEIRTNTWVRLISILVWFGLFPIASEAFGTKKAISIWWIGGLTVLASLLFFGPYYQHGILSDQTRPWMLWAGTENPPPDDSLTQSNANESPKELMRKMRAIYKISLASYGDRFHFYQLFTNLWIHAGIMHLAGNMVFMLVFGIRVNELIGNIRMAIIYPILGILSNLVFMYSVRNEPLAPSLGASGAIMGLAGMYFVFFPVQKVHMVIWLRGGFLTGWRVWYKIFRMSGFWLLFLWVGLNDVLPTLLSGNEAGDGVAHWAHLGGFISGFLIAVALMMARQVDAHGSDLLSMVFGPAAWKILGRPGAQAVNITTDVGL